VIPFEAENYIPIPPSESYLDFEVVPPLSGSPDHFDVLLAAIPQSIVNPYYRVLRQAGLEPLALEIESLSTSRALIKNGLSNHPILLIDFGATRTGLIIFSGTSVRLTTLLHTSSRKLTEALAQGLGINFDEAERIKIDYGLELKTKVKLQEKTGDLELEKEVTEDRSILRILNPILMDLVREIKDYLDFYYSHVSHEHLQSEKAEVKKVLLSGGGANMKGLDKFFAKELGITVELGNPWVNVLPSPQEIIPEKYLRRSLAFTNSLGLALRGVMAVD
jgi:type IV pilus assembly protein PilM